MEIGNECRNDDDPATHADSAASRQYRSRRELPGS